MWRSQIWIQWENISFGEVSWLRRGLKQKRVKKDVVRKLTSWIKALVPVYAALCEVHKCMFFGPCVNLCYQPGTESGSWIWLLKNESSGPKVHKILIALKSLWFLVDKYLLTLRKIKRRWESDVQHNLVCCIFFLHSLLLSAAAWWPLGCLHCGIKAIFYTLEKDELSCFQEHIVLNFALTLRPVAGIHLFP